MSEIYTLSTGKFESAIGLKDGMYDFVAMIPNQDNGLIEDLPGIKDFLRLQRVKLVQVFVKELIVRYVQIFNLKSLGDARLSKYVVDYKTYIKAMKEIFKDMNFDRTIKDSVLLFCERDTYEYKKFNEAIKICEVTRLCTT